MNDKIKELVAFCRENGVLLVRLPDGTEIHLDPGFQARQELRASKSPAILLPESEFNKNNLVAELDHELFGKPLK